MHRDVTHDVECIRHDGLQTRACACLIVWYGSKVLCQEVYVTTRAFPKYESHKFSKTINNGFFPFALFVYVYFCRDCRHLRQRTDGVLFVSLNTSQKCIWLRFTFSCTLCMTRDALYTVLRPRKPVRRAIFTELACEFFLAQGFPQVHTQCLFCKTLSSVGTAAISASHGNHFVSLFRISPSEQPRSLSLATVAQPDPLRHSRGVGVS